MDLRITPRTGAINVTGESAPVALVRPVRAKVVYVDFRRPLPVKQVRVANFEATGPPKYQFATIVT